MKKLVKRLGLMGMLLGCTGCLSPRIESHVVRATQSPIDKSEQLLLSIEHKRSYLGGASYIRLKQFICIAQPQEILQWRQYFMTYKLESQAIFLDKKARTCRRYLFQCKSFLPWVKSVQCMETACRGMDGQWKTVHAQVDSA